jgi:hypothetical protein
MPGRSSSRSTVRPREADLRVRHSSRTASLTLTDDSWDNRRSGRRSRGCAHHGRLGARAFRRQLCRCSRRATSRCQLDYEYEARKRLYTEFQPLLFQLVELSERAYYRIFGFAESSGQGHLRDDGMNWLEAEYYRLSSYYRLFAPLAVFRLCQRRLTLVDLSVDPRVRRQYALAKLCYLTWHQGFELAHTEPSLPYEIYDRSAARSTDPRRDAMQHVVAGHLDQIADALIFREPDGVLRCATYGEFEQRYADEDSDVHRAVRSIEYLLRA